MYRTGINRLNLITSKIQSTEQ